MDTTPYTAGFRADAYGTFVGTVSNAGKTIDVTGLCACQAQALRLARREAAYLNAEAAGTRPPLSTLRGVAA